MGVLRGLHEITAVGATSGLLAAVSLGAGCERKAVPEPGGDVKVTSEASASAVPTGAWSVKMTTTGGELGHDTQVIAIEGDGQRGTATRTQSAPGGAAREERTTLTPERTAALWKTIEETGAWELGDFKREALDSPAQVFELRTGQKSHTIHAEGGSGSPQHLRLILEIQRCAAQTGETR